jgi:hypothetical protein
LHRLRDLEVPLRRGVEFDVAPRAVGVQPRDRLEDPRAGVLDVRQRRARGPNRRLVRGQPDALQSIAAELVPDPVARPARRERLGGVQGEHGVGPLAQPFQERVVGAEVRPGQEFHRCKSVTLGQEVGPGVGPVHGADVEPPGGHVDEGHPVPGVAVRAGGPAHQRGEVAGVRVGRLEDRPRGDHPLDPPGVAAVVGLVLVGDRHAVAALDERGEVGREFVDGNAGHRVRGTVG